MPINRQGRWLAMGLLVLAAVIGPFLLFGDGIETWTASFVATAGRNRLLVALVLGGMLASDIVLPIPSSIVSTACGLLLGFPVGLFVSAAGMAVSCLAGYGLAGGVGRPWVRRAMGEDELRRFGRLMDRFGTWAIVLARPIPVLAEVSVLAAGAARMRFWRFFWLTTLSNIGISAAYAAIGAFAGDVNSFLLAVAGSILLPWLAMGATRSYGRPAAAAGRPGRGPTVSGRFTGGEDAMDRDSPQPLARAAAGQGRVHERPG